MDWTGWVTTIGVPGLVAVTLTALLNHLHTRGQAGLEARLNRLAAEHKAELDRIVLEHQIRFSELHSKRAEIAHGIHTKLCWAASHFSTATSRIKCGDEPSNEEMFQEFWKHFVEFKNYYVENRIYLSTSLCELIDSYVKALDRASSDHGYWLNKEINQDHKTELFERVEDAKKMLPDIQTKIEQEFRRLLGVECGDQGDEP